LFYVSGNDLLTL